MPYSIDKKLVIAIASSALFDLSESQNVYRENGVDAYRVFQEDNIDNTLKKGVAFPFIRRLLKLNELFSDLQPVEVVLLSRNSPETGMRVFRSIKSYGLDISRAAFFSGVSPFKYLPAYNASLFLSANDEDVIKARNAGFAAGKVIETTISDDENDSELRIAFDFDGVLADDSSEVIYQKNKDLKEFHDHETEFMEIPHGVGPLQDLCKKISFYQKLETREFVKNSNYKRVIRISIVTARNAPSHERMINTLKSWGINVDEAFFLGGIEKKRIIEVMKPHIYFEDQKVHLKDISNIPLVHIPFGITNTNE